MFYGFFILRLKLRPKGKIAPTVQHCNPKVKGSIPGAGNLKKLLIWMKIHGVIQTIRLRSDGQANVSQQ